MHQAKTDCPCSLNSSYYVHKTRRSQDHELEHEYIYYEHAIRIANEKKSYGKKNPNANNPKQFKKEDWKQTQNAQNTDSAIFFHFKTLEFNEHRDGDEYRSSVFRQIEMIYVIGVPKKT